METEMQYATTAQEAAALVETYMVAGGNNHPSVIAEWLSEYSDEELVSDLMQCWDTDIERSDLTAAMAGFRENFTN